MYLPTENVDVKVVWPFIQATVDALRVQFGVEAKPGKPYLREPDEKITREISGWIGLTGATFSGCVTLCFQQAQICNMLRKAFGEAEDPTPDMMDEAVAELLNIICGQASRAVSDKGIQLGRAIPMVMSGIDIRVRYVRGHSILLPIHSAMGDFFIEVTSQKK